MPPIVDTVLGGIIMIVSNSRRVHIVGYSLMDIVVKLLLHKYAIIVLQLIVALNGSLKIQLTRSSLV